MHAVTAEMSHHQRADALEKENVQLRQEIARLRSNKENATSQPDDDSVLSKKAHGLHISETESADVDLSGENQELRVSTAAIDLAISVYVETYLWRLGQKPLAGAGMPGYGSQNQGA